MRRGAISTQRKQYSAEFKARVALEALKGLKTVNELVSPYGVHPTLIAHWTSGSTGTEISGRDLSGKRPLHRLIDFTASELESNQKGCRKQQDWRPAKSRSFLH